MYAHPGSFVAVTIFSSRSILCHRLLRAQFCNGILEPSISSFVMFGNEHVLRGTLQEERLFMTMDGMVS